jgi:DHA3 family multidrug efflux protein-like MFS transporter
MRIFYAVLANSLLASVVNNFVWFAVTFWVYLETKSVLATSIMAGIYSATVAVSGIFLGSVVDRYRKKTAMVLSSAGSLVLYSAALILYLATPASVFRDTGNATLWIFIALTLFGAIVGNVRSIALSTMVTILIAEPQRDRANGLVGTATGISFAAASVFSGLAVGLLGMFAMLALSVGLTALAGIHAWFLAIPESKKKTGGHHTQRIDLRGTIRVVREVPGLFALLFFNTFNNFLGGIFMSLMDAYGLSLVSVEAWGILWGFLSLGFIFGGLAVSKHGLGPRPLRTLFLCNVVMWTICVFFTLHASIVLLTAGLFVYLCLIPVVEAAEQTIFQKVIEPGRQGRVFGFAQSLEQAASPVMAFLIGPVAQYVFIPFMTTGRGVDWIGGWFGTGQARGLALLFTLAGLIGLAVTVLAWRSRAYRHLARSYHGKRGKHEEAAHSD